jgi:hypothetical protein
VAALYPKLRDFLQLQRDMDPNRKFSNEFVEVALGLGVGKTP